MLRVRALRSLGLPAAAGLVVALFGESAAAQRTREVAVPILVVVESADSRIDVPALRQALGRQLGVPIVALHEAQGASVRGTLSIAVEHRGRVAHVYFLPRHGVHDAVLVTVQAGPRADPAGRWLIEPALAVIRQSFELAARAELGAEVIDPWIAVHIPPALRPDGPYVIPDDIVDPFVDLPPEQRIVSVSDYRLGPEVVDPWAMNGGERLAESGERLGAPRPGVAAGGEDDW